MKAIALDFETYYDNNVSLTKMAPHCYVRDPKFRVLCASVYGNEINWSGTTLPPRELLENSLIIAHNASFERTVVEFFYPGLKAQWFDTADLTAYLRVKRGLDSAAKYLLNESAEKDTRKKLFKVSDLSALPPSVRQEIIDYNARDARLSFSLYQKYAQQWPEFEQACSRMNLELCMRGLPIDLEYVNATIHSLEQQEFDTLREIPWALHHPPLSPLALREEARKANIPVPLSLDQRNPEAIRWENTYGEKYPWVRAVRTFRKIHTLLTRFKALQSITDPTTQRAPIQIKYFGSHTGRFSGGGETGQKFNVLNMSDELRPCIRAPVGWKIVTMDYDQIEARITFWMTGARYITDKLKQGKNLYEIEAHLILGIPEEECSNLSEKNPSLYAMVKAVVLGCTYGMSGRTFQLMAPLLSGGQYNPTAHEAERMVRLFRNKHIEVTRAWALGMAAFKNSVNNQQTQHVVKLPSGRELIYYYPRFKDFFGFIATPVLGGPEKKLHGGLLFENKVQAFASDLLRKGMVDARPTLEKYGAEILFTLHDEFVFMCPSDSAESFAKEVKEKIIESAKDWAYDLPLSLKVKITDAYQ